MLISVISFFNLSSINIKICVYVYYFRYIGESSKVALLLDYDGTLAPIAPHPDLAILPVETKNVLQRLSNMSDVYIAIISGRNVNNVMDMVNICVLFHLARIMIEKREEKKTHLI